MPEISKNSILGKLSSNNENPYPISKLNARININVSKMEGFSGTFENNK